MTARILGAVCIVAGCAGFGFSIASTQQKDEKYLLQLMRAVEWMICELEYRMTPLPELCRMAGSEAGGAVGQVLSALAAALDKQEGKLVSDHMEQILGTMPQIPSRTRQNLILLGRSLGKFALSGQVTGLRSALVMCKRDLDGLAVGRDARLRSYRTLGICGGVALVILFI